MRNALASVSAAALAEQVIGQTSSASATGVPTRVLGRTGQRISILGVGGGHARAIKDDAECIRYMHAAVDEGVTFFDNAWEYGDGAAEEIMGKALAQEGYRKKVFLMTKNCGRDYKDSMNCLEDSLRRLQTDHVDLWQFHEVNYDNDPDWIFERGAIKAALEARKAGKVRFIGFTGHKDSAHPPEHAGQALRVGHLHDAGQCGRRELPQLPEGSHSGVSEEERRNPRLQGLGRRARSAVGQGETLRWRSACATASACRWPPRSWG